MKDPRAVAIEKLTRTLTSTTHELAVIVDMDKNAPQAGIAEAAMYRAKADMEKVLKGLEDASP